MRNKILLGCIACLMVFSFMIPVKATSEKEVEPIADAEVNLSSPDQNSGSSNYLHIGADIFGDQQQTFLKFEIPTLSQTIVKVTVKTYWYSFMCETPLNVSACKVSNDWEEYTITWNNKPACGQNSSSVLLSDRTWFDLDVTSSIEGETYLSLCIYENTPYKPDGLQGYSREGSYNNPIMIIEYDNTAEVLTGVIIGSIIGGIVLVSLISACGQKGKNREKIMAAVKTNHQEEKSHMMNIPQKVIEVMPPLTGAKFCPSCGGSIKNIKAQYCKECGANLND